MGIFKASNGVCPSFCPSGEKFPDPKPYGVNFPGANFKFTWSELSGRLRVTQGVQLHQSGYLALQTPYVFFGLGRTSNYVEQMFIGVSIVSDSGYYKLFPIFIIPNSQLIMFPYKPGNPDSWTLELFIRTSGLTLWVIVAVVSTLIINGLIVYFFKWREKREDALLRQETAHLFSFDAM